MKRFSARLKGLGEKLKSGLRFFMLGRYGTDKLNLTLLGVALAASAMGMFFRHPAIALLMTAVSYGLMIWAIFRMLSRNTYQRYRENRKFLQLLEQWKDRQHRYYNCPRCRQTVRVPRGKGKISITCPRCKEQFIKKT